MSFSGKATYTAGVTLPELAEDVADLVGIVSPFETPLLHALGDPAAAALSTRHEWLEDALLPNTDSINDATIAAPDTETDFDVTNGDRFRVGDQIQTDASEELMFVTAVNANTLTVLRGYAGTTPESLIDDQAIRILGNAALEGADKPAVRFTNRQRRSNYTQIFTAAVEVSGSDMAAKQAGVGSEMENQKTLRLRELLRDLENTVINGGQPLANPQGSAIVRRSMRGILPHLNSNVFHSGDPGLPAGNDLTEEMLNVVLRQIWENSSSPVDLIVVNGFQKRRINEFVSANRSFGANDRTFTDLVSLYESDFGQCRIVLSRWLPRDAVLLLDSKRLSVLPLSGRSFHFKPLPAAGDYESGQLIGEYTLELRNENAHGLLRGLSVT